MGDHLFNFDFKLGDFDLIDELNEALSDSRKVSDWLHDNQTNLNKTNLDYVERFKCSARMKYLNFATVHVAEYTVSMPGCHGKINFR